MNSPHFQRPVCAPDIVHAGLVHRHALKNRTIVSSDIRPMLEDIAIAAGLDLRLHRFASGADIGTWVVPPRWDVREAWLRGPDGRLIASYRDHPLFAVPYSRPFQGTVSLETLRSHVCLHPSLDDAFYYEHRLAYDFTRRLGDWAVTLPKRILDELEPGDYQIHLDFDVGDGEMLVGELVLPGETEQTIALLADYCHPGQVNDSFSGILAMLQVMERLKEAPRRFTYRLFLLPETIGSAVLLHTSPRLAELTRLAIFSEFVGWGGDWKIQGRQEPETLTARLGRDAVARWDGLAFDDLFAGYGNDELVFDFVGIPALSVQMNPCREYHSSHDSPDRLVQANLDQAAAIILGLCDVMERNDTYVLTQAVPFYMSRFGLYADASTERPDYMRNRAMVRALRRPASLLDIAYSQGIAFDEVADYVGRLLAHGLVRKVLAHEC